VIEICYIKCTSSELSPAPTGATSKGVIQSNLYLRTQLVKNGLLIAKSTQIEI
jgi:hypothetical protein